ncbi:MAG: TRAP transporter large permease subunit [Planctomycetes bacterium]|nr:TRAP transporter large permease subunit [Planctomycetota bacterium]HPY75485.1 TRAP transporter large permease subunit [Planctomycetota bacterium]HQB00325.1 TRAP transporter large permease subunit [Planctomycetota bacterium]
MNKSYIHWGNFFVILLWICVFLCALDIFFLRPAVVQKEQQNMGKQITTWIQRRPHSEYELPSALALTIPQSNIETISNENEEKSELPEPLPSNPNENKFRFLSLLLALLGAPLFSIIGTMSIFLSPSTTSIFVDVVDKLTSHSLFIPLPLFTFAGYVLSESKAPTRIVRFSKALLGWMPGGTVFIAVLSCAFFTAFTGASGVTIVALGGLLYPMLKQENYSDTFTLGMITIGGSLGMLFPPSLPMILYGVIASNSMQGMTNATLQIKDLFLAGLIPGTLTLLVVGLYGAFQNLKTEITTSSFSFQELKESTKAVIPELLIPFVMLGGYYGGVLQLTESAAVTALYVVLIEKYYYKDIQYKQLINITQKSMVLIGAILIILMLAMSMTNLMILAKVPDQLLQYMKEHVTSPWTFLLLLNGFLIIIGCLMDIFSATLVIIPLIMPVALAFQIDPIHLGIIFVTNLSIGYATPPVGMNLFITSIRFKKSIFYIAYTCIPFILLLFVVLGLVTYIPALSLYPIQYTWIIPTFYVCLVTALVLFSLWIRKKNQKIA